MQYFIGNRKYKIMRICGHIQTVFDNILLTTSDCTDSSQVGVHSAAGWGSRGKHFTFLSADWWLMTSLSEEIMRMLPSGPHSLRSQVNYRWAMTDLDWNWLAQDLWLSGHAIRECWLRKWFVRDEICGYWGSEVSFLVRRDSLFPVSPARTGGEYYQAPHDSLEYIN